MKPVYFELKVELDNTVLHKGTYEECLMIFNAMIKYGIHEDKLIIVENIPLN
jgi:hypothetical protein